MPEGFPPVVYPEDNTFTADRYELGRRLFYDPILSADSSISCASCHLPELAFSDQVALSPEFTVARVCGMHRLLANVAYHPYFSSGRQCTGTLEQQVLVPIQEENEMAHNIVAIASAMERDSSYVAMSISAYNRPPDAFVITHAWPL